MNGLCVNLRLSGMLACPAGPWPPTRGVRGPWETPVRGAPYPAQLQLRPFWLPAPLGCGILLRRAGRETPAPPPWRQQKNAAAWRRKKGHPPSCVLLVAQTHRKIILSSVVATSTFYARTRVRSRLRTQLFKKIVKNEKVRGQQSVPDSVV